jgi:hypothetical protein
MYHAFVSNQDMNGIQDLAFVLVSTTAQKWIIMPKWEYEK